MVNSPFPIKQETAMKDVRFINIILLISVIGVLIVPLSVIYFLTPAFTDFLLDDSEKRLIQVAERMAGSLEDEGSIGYQSITPHFVQKLKDIRKSIGLTKVKIFA